MKKRICLCIAGVVFLLYAASLFWISSKQNPYLVEMSVENNYLTISREESGAFYYIPVQIRNASNRTISSQLNVNLSYHLYRAGQEENTLVSIENHHSEIPNIFPEDCKTVELQYEIPMEKGLYIIYIDLLEEDGKWYSEYGMKTPYITIEVR